MASDSELLGLLVHDDLNHWMYYVLPIDKLEFMSAKGIFWPSAHWFSKVVHKME